MRLRACLLLCALAAAAPAAEPAVTRTFDVAAVTTPIPDCPMPPLGKVTGPVPTPVADRAAPLADLLRTLDAVAPDAAGWATFGDAGRRLTVTHAPAVVERVAVTLADLEARRNRSVAVEVRVLTLPAGMAATAGLPADGRSAVIDAGQLTRVLSVVQGHRRTSVLQAPKLTVFDCQRAGLWVGEEQVFVTAVEQASPGDAALPKSETYRTGTAVEVRPVVAADRKSAALDVGFQQAEIDGPVPLFPVTSFVTPVGEGKPVPFTQFVQQPKLTRRDVRQAATVADGQTLVLFAGPKTEWADVTDGPLARVPYVNRLFATRTPLPQEVVVLVTPRVQP